MDFWFTFIGLGMVLGSKNENQRAVGTILASAGVANTLRRRYEQKE